MARPATLINHPLTRKAAEVSRPVRAGIRAGRAAFAAELERGALARRGKRPVLGIAGFFGHGNYGDELFLSVFEEYFGGHFDLVVIPDLPTKPYFSRDLAEMVAGVDAIVIGGGDLLQPWNDDPRYFNHAYLAKPVFVMGIGVPIRPQAQFAAKPHLLNRYRRFFNHPNVKMVGVRDDSSAKWVRENIAPAIGVTVAPDIVCSLTLPPVAKRAADEAPVLGVVTRFRPGRETPDDYSRLEELAAHVTANGWRVKHLILGTGIVGERDIANADDFHFEGKTLVSSESLDDLSREIGTCDALVSMKFHGSVVATMYEVPSVVLVGTSKNRSFMRRIGREDLVSAFDATDLVEKFQPKPADPDHDAVERLRQQSTAFVTECARLAREVVGPYSSVR